MQTLRVSLLLLLTFYLMENSVSLRVKLQTVTWNRLWKKKRRKTQLHRKQAQMDQFVKQVLEEEKFSQEQKSYLLDCLEQGEEMEEVLYLAKSCLSVEQMERIKQLLSEHPQMFWGSRRKPWNQKKKVKEG